MRALLWFLAALAGALVGAAAWAAIGYFANMELGWIAWGLGVLAGLGALRTAQEHAGQLSGACAVLAAIIGIGAGKVGVAGLLLNQYMSQSGHTEEGAIVRLAKTVVRDAQRRSKPLAWPSGVKPDEADELSEFPPDVAAEARRRWSAVPAAERTRAMAWPHALDEEWLISALADEIEAERSITPPAGANVEDTLYREDHDSAVWAEAESRWKAMDAGARSAYVDKLIADLQSSMRSARSRLLVMAMSTALTSGLSGFDALWVLLAALSAWRIGSGGRRDAEA